MKTRAWEWPGANGRLAVGYLLLLAFLLGLAGCGETPVPVDDQAGMRNLMFLARFYGRYQAMSRGAVPPSEEALKKFMQGPIAAEVQASGVTNVDDVFISPRDKQPYVITYKKPPRNPGINGDPIFAYEATGVDGKRLVSTMVGTVQEMDAEQFKAAVPDAQ
jgi:hypothetical protein